MRIQAENPGRLPRVLFVGEAVTLAHVIRPLGLARGLDHSRYEVVFACDRRHESLVHREGLSYSEIHSIEPKLFADRLYRGAALYTLDELQGYVQEDLRLIAKVKPDVVVGDFRISMGISAELSDVPYLALSNAHWSPSARLPMPVPEHPVVGMLGARMVKPMLQMLLPFFMGLQARAFNRIRNGVGLDPVRGRGAPDVYTRGTRTLYLDVPELYGMEPGEGEAFVGPMLWFPDTAKPEWWDLLPTDRPVAFVSSGSSGDPAVMEKAIRALAGQNLCVMVATAGRLPLEGWPAGVFAAEFIPGLLAAQRADIVVCNGGSGLVYQALSRGRPVVGIPTNMDQYYVMDAVERQGAGKTVRAGELTPRRVKSAVETVLSDASYRAAALRMREYLLTVDPIRSLTANMDAVIGNGWAGTEEEPPAPVWAADCPVGQRPVPAGA